MTTRFRIVGIMIFAVLLIVHSTLTGQFSGVPMVRSFGKMDYRSGSSNWDIDQDPRGVICIANNNGLLTYDGFNWTTYRLPNKTTARSVMVNTDGSIYTGGQNEIGFFFPDEKGMLEYHSILEKVPHHHRTFTDVWQIERTDDLIFWRTQEKLFVFDGDTVSVLDTLPFLFIAPFGNTMMLQSNEGRLYTYENGNIRQFPGADTLIGTMVTEMFAISDTSWLLVTEKDGIWQLSDQGFSTWNEQLNGLLRNDLLYSGLRLTDGRIAFGTTYAGIVITDGQGRLLELIDKITGLLMTQTICLFEDRGGNLWTGLNNGVSMISAQSAFSYYFPDGDLQGVGYQSIIHRDTLYFATSNGLYFRPLKRSGPKGDFHLVPGTIGQAWGLSVVNGQLILSHNNGAFLIKGHHAEMIFDKHGTWLFQEDYSDPGKWIIGTYYGVYIMDAKNHRDCHRLGKMSESSRFLCQDKAGTIWVAHPYRGIYRIDRTPEGGILETHYTDKNGLPSQLNNHVFRIKGDIVFSASDGFYDFDEKSGSFIPDSSWYKLFDPGVKVRRLYEATNGDIWFVTESEIGFFDLKEIGLEREFQRRTFPQVYPMLNGTWEHIYPYDDRNVFIATSTGFIHVDPARIDADSTTFELILTEVHAGSKYEKKIFGGYFNDNLSITGKQEEDNVLRIPFEDNSVKFHVAATDFKNPGSLQFRWQLKGLENQFSNWSELRYKEYTQLGPGPYELVVECRDATGNIKQLSYRFVLETPWYRSLLFQVLIVILLISALGYYILNSEKKIGEMEEKVEETVKESEARTAILEQEKIMAELEHKRRELVSSTMHLANMQENYTDIKERIRQIRQYITNPKAKEEVSRLMRMMDMNEHVEDHWENIMLHFNEVHGDLLSRLRKTFPELSSKDLKLCTYLRMNLSTKEIASLMNVSTRGVEASRYRLRKKLGLDSGDDLVEFLMTY